MLNLKDIVKLKEIVEADYGLTGLSENKVEAIGINLLALFETLIMENKINSSFKSKKDYGEK